jgi:hypothetical protein
MGNFYTSYTLRGSSQQSVAIALAGRSAMVTQAQAGCVVVFDEESDKQDQEIIAELASRLSGQFRCPLLAVLNHDDSILWYQLYLSGELVDEYNSAPGYFETGDEEAAGPEGGDVKKLCNAFGSNAVAKVESILREPTAADNGYIFEIERHMELARALGIPVFGAGGFEQINEEALPGGLAEDSWITTKDLAAGPPLEDIWRKPVPGYYKVSFRAHPKLTKSIPTSWMPNLWADLDCQEQQLSDQFRKTTTAYRDKFKNLGFTELGFKQNKRILNPISRESGGINYLGGDGRYFGQIIYNRSCTPPTKKEKEIVVIAFTAVFQDETFSCTNRQDFLEPIPNHNVVRLQSNDAAFIHEQFVQHLKQRTDSPRHFQDLPSLQAWFDANAREIFEFRVHRGSWVRMSDFEVEVARRKL